MKVVDLGSQMSALFEQEKMLAFFDATIHLPGRPPVDVLGRLSRPETNAAGNSYLSMFLLIDTPDEALRAEVESFFKRIDWSRWRQLFDGIVEVVPMPPMHALSDLYIAAVDIITRDENIAHVLGGPRLLGTLGQISDIEIGQITSWGDAEKDADSPSRWQQLKDRILGRG